MNPKQTYEYPTADTVMTSVMVGAMALIGCLMILSDTAQSVLA